MSKQLIFSPSPFKLALVVFLFSAFFFLADIGESSIRFSDEGTHVRVIQDMYHSGDYLDPKLDKDLYVNKPPLKMWLTVFLLKYLGESNFSYRLIDGLCSAGIVALVSLFALSIFGTYFSALLASFVLLGSHGFFYGGRFNTATQDAFVVFFNTLALWIFYKANQVVIEKKGKLNTLSMMAFGLSLACGVLAKTIVGLVPLIIIFPVLIFKRQLLKDLIKFNLGPVFASIVAFSIPVGCYYFQLLYRHTHVWEKIFGYDIKERLFTEGFHNPEKWWFYLERLFVNSEFCAEWLLVAAILFQLVSTLRKLSFVDLLLTSWSLVPLILFSALQSRAFHYIGPAFPAFALIIAGMMNSALNVVKAESWSYGKLTRYLCLFVLVFGSVEIGSSIYRASDRMLSDKRKLPIELAVQDLKKLSKPDLSIGTYQLSELFAGLNNQRWRQEFYLEMLAPQKLSFETLEQIKESSKNQKIDVLFSSFPAALELLKAKKGDSRICAYAPLWRAESKRQSVNPSAGDPQALAILYGSCNQKPELSYFTKISDSFSLDSPKIKNYYGLGPKEFIANRAFWRSEHPEIVLSFARNDVWKNLATQISFVAATERVSGQFLPLNLKLFLNGNYIGSQQLTGGKFRNYSFNLPPNSWRGSENLVVLHFEPSDSQNNLSSSKVLLSAIKVELLDEVK